MKVLLDTNIVIHREASTIVNDEIGTLFGWLDRLHYKKCIHPITVEEIRQHKDPKIIHSMEVKLKSYEIMPTIAPIDPRIQQLLNSDMTQNSKNDSKMLNELVCGRVNLIITEDKGIHNKAVLLSQSNNVFTIDSFLEKTAKEHPGFIDYQILSIRKEYFGNIDLEDPFFNQFKEDYIGFSNWFNGKADEQAYVCMSERKIIGFLYLKEENIGEDYSDISPTFNKAKRLKIGCLKVMPTHYRLGERFIKIIFDNALNLGVDEIYTTVFNKRAGQLMLITFLNSWGFYKHGTKETPSGIEEVYVRNFRPAVNNNYPNLSFPYFSLKKRIFLVSIYPQYHTELFPDSILRTESPLDFVENQPHRNSIRKVFISRSWERNISKGDIAIFYRTGGYYQGVVTTLGIIEDIITGIENEQDFISLCRQRSVFSDDELQSHWNYNVNSRPFIVNFLYAYSFPKRPNLKRLIDLKVIKSVADAPRGFLPITADQCRIILQEAKANESLAIN